MPRNMPERDDQGRFVSDDDRSRGGGRRHYAESRRDDDYRGSSRYEDDDRGRGHGGWFGDPQGHAEVARRGWDENAAMTGIMTTGVPAVRAMAAGLAIRKAIPKRRAAAGMSAAIMNMMIVAGAMFQSWVRATIRSPLPVVRLEKVRIVDVIISCRKPGARHAIF